MAPARSPRSSLVGAMAPARSPGSSLVGAMAPARSPGTSLVGAMAPARSPGSSLVGAMAPARSPGSSLVAGCKCDRGTFGRYCERSADACEEPCFPNVSCVPGKGCEACPPDLTGDGRHCADRRWSGEKRRRQRPANGESWVLGFPRCLQRHEAQVSASHKSGLLRVLAQGSSSKAGFHGLLGSPSAADLPAPSVALGSSSLCWNQSCPVNYCYNQGHCYISEALGCRPSCTCPPAFTDSRCLLAGNNFTPTVSLGTARCPAALTVALLPPLGKMGKLWGHSTELQVSLGWGKVWAAGAGEGSCHDEDPGPVDPLRKEPPLRVIRLLLSEEENASMADVNASVAYRLRTLHVQAFLYNSEVNRIDSPAPASGSPVQYWTVTSQFQYRPWGPVIHFLNNQLLAAVVEAFLHQHVPRRREEPRNDVVFQPLSREDVRDVTACESVHPGDGSHVPAVSPSQCSSPALLAAAAQETAATYFHKIATGFLKVPLHLNIRKGIPIISALQLVVNVSMLRTYFKCSGYEGYDLVYGPQSGFTCVSPCSRGYCDHGGQCQHLPSGPRCRCVGPRPGGG
ncbi:hypothetical protein P7K49_031263 [Saguinus oedipus]|uniref:EGF-like domain-containing protein n=1 Tax=Saguinus oedipus TaxID=9490 RepID=A0ABQ9U0T7_SAGOE|nr:hypothetical protein P7K49_031263 [Saguinus oedipus]